MLPGGLLASRVTQTTWWNQLFRVWSPSKLLCPQVSRFIFGRLDDELCSILTDTAQDAFIGNTIFKLDTVDRKIGDVLRELRFEAPPLLKDLGTHVHYLEMTIRVSLGDLNKPQNHNADWAAIEDIKSLEFHFPNIKTCVLSLELGLPMREVHEPEVPAFDRRHATPSCEFPAMISRRSRMASPSSSNCSPVRAQGNHDSSGYNAPRGSTTSPCFLGGTQMDSATSLW